MRYTKLSCLFLSIAALSGCANIELPPSALNSAMLAEDGSYLYRIGTSDILSIFVWDNPDISGSYPVSPDGNINMALSGTLSVVGKSSRDVQDLLTAALGEYIKHPKVTVQITSAAGNTMERVKLVGEAVTPSSLPYLRGMTLLDLMISVGGLSPYADGNDAELFRVENGAMKVYPLRLSDLMKDADLTANVDLMPGDVIRVPEAWF